MPIRSVVSKLWLAFTGLMLIVVIPLELGMHRLLTDFYATQVTEPLLYHSEQLAHMLAMDPNSLEVAPMMGQMVGGEVLVVDSQGVPIPFPGSAQVPPPAVALSAALRGATFAGQVQVGDGESYIVTAAPIKNRGGAVLLFAPAEPVQRSLLVARRYLWIAGGVMLLLGTGLALMLARSLLRPVIAIEQATRSIARGDFATRVTVPSEDEIGRLAAAVNQMTAQLQAYEARRREFLANVAHELRTPLSYIRGYTQAMAEGLVQSEEERDRYQKVVHEETVRIGRLVDDLMDIAQIDEGQMAFDRTPLNLRLPIEQASATISPRASERQIRIIIDLPADLPQPMADGGRIQQVVLNLLDNGLRHTAAGGMLRLSAHSEEGWVEVRVKDSGPGVEADALPLLFERFHKRHESGRGLGLAIVRSIIRAHGGEVGVDSEPGKGSSFWFRLPTTSKID